MTYYSCDDNKWVLLTGARPISDPMCSTITFSQNPFETQLQKISIANNLNGLPPTSSNGAYFNKDTFFNKDVPGQMIADAAGFVSRQFPEVQKVVQALPLPELQSVAQAASNFSTNILEGSRLGDAVQSLANSIPVVGEVLDVVTSVVSPVFDIIESVFGGGGGGSGGGGSSVSNIISSVSTIFGGGSGRGTDGGAGGGLGGIVKGIGNFFSKLF